MWNRSWKRSRSMLAVGGGGGLHVNVDACDSCPCDPRLHQTGTADHMNAAVKNGTCVIPDIENLILGRSGHGRVCTYDSCCIPIPLLYDCHVISSVIIIHFDQTHDEGNNIRNHIIATRRWCPFCRMSIPRASVSKSVPGMVFPVSIFPANDRRVRFLFSLLSLSFPAHHVNLIKSGSRN
jgi:hypothetical protein